MRMIAKIFLVENLNTLDVLFFIKKKNFSDLKIYF